MTTTQNDAECTKENHILDLPAGPVQVLAFAALNAIYPCTDKAKQVHQAVPVDF